MKPNLISKLDSFKNKKVVVWGDLILDEYILTTTARVSREAPVLITEFESNEYRLGGAGNVVLNLKSLGANPIPVAFIGNDPDGKTLRRILKEKSVNTDFLIDSVNFKTPKKSRVLAGGENTKKQQVLRIDTLNCLFKSDADAFTKLENLLGKLLKDTDLLVVSDYLYNTVKADILNRLIVKNPKCLVIVDSRNNLLQFTDIAVATPNEPEIKSIFPGKQFYKNSDFIEAGTDLMNKINAKGILLKRGHKGMVVFERGKKPEIVDIHGSRDIVDETGAGDTVISVFALSFASGMDMYTSASLANIAAGYVVMKSGCYPLTIDELKNELL